MTETAAQAAPVTTATVANASGPRPCECSRWTRTDSKTTECAALVAGRKIQFRPGHDAKLKSFFIAAKHANLVVTRTAPDGTAKDYEAIDAAGLFGFQRFVIDAKPRSKKAAKADLPAGAAGDTAEAAEAERLASIAADEEIARNEAEALAKVRAATSAKPRATRNRRPAAAKA